MSFAENIQIVRKKAGVSQQEFAKMLGFHQTLISKYELGERKPNLRNAFKILELTKKYKMKLTLEDFL